MTLYEEDARREVRAYLESLTLHGIKLGLQNMHVLVAAAGNPHGAYPSVHIAGTNGKGSVAAFLNAVLRASGYRTGRFTSPHLLDVTERFLINDTPLDEACLAENIRYFRTLADAADIRPTYFEMNTAIAFRAFAQHKVDIAVVEVGMGGRFDATNVVAPVCCAITNIEYDHMQYLGNTLEEIAFEKGGILKPNTPAVLGPVAPAPLSVIEQRGRDVGAPLSLRGRNYHASAAASGLHPRITYKGPIFSLQDKPLGLSGTHQVDNAAVAIALAEIVSVSFPAITPDTVETGLMSARWPGRLERILDHPPVFMDVAHNPAGCRTVAETAERWVTILSVSSDKAAREMVDILARVSSPLILTEYSGGRSLPLDDLCKAAEGHAYIACNSLEKAIAEGMKRASREVPLLITGSIYAAGEARAILVEQYGAHPVVF
jgi:dihydrofolate synthase/folylpolyglutamate synthase